MTIVPIAVGIESLAAGQCAIILGFLVVHITPPALTPLRWAPKTFAIRVNRLCVHQAFKDQDGLRRDLDNTTIADETPACRAAVSRSCTPHSGNSGPSSSRYEPFLSSLNSAGGIETASSRRSTRSCLL